MTRITMSAAASGLLRALIPRAGIQRNRILLIDIVSVDWRSLTFSGERHQITLRATGRDSLSAIQRMCRGLEDAEFNIPGIIVADIAAVGAPDRALDGSTAVTIEALTIAAD